LTQINAQFNIATTMRNQKEFIMRRSLAIMLLNLVLLSGATALLTACNTTAGAGKDVSAAGHAVTNSADKVKSGM